jgi:Ser/Thr protein kinase RdoA (MazF antagonist)
MRDIWVGGHPRLSGLSLPIRGYHLECRVKEWKHALKKNQTSWLSPHACEHLQSNHRGSIILSMQFTPSIFEKTWPITHVTCGDTLTTTAGRRTVSVIHAREGSFVCKIADEWKTSEALTKGLLAFELLPEKGFRHIPKLIKTKQGDTFEAIAGNYVYLLEYVGGRNPDPTVVTYAKLGLLTAELHAVEHYPYRTGFDPAKIIAKGLISIAKGLPFQAEYLEVVRSLPSFDGLPQAVIHTDIGPVNAIEKANGEMILIDWDDVGIGIRILDIAFPLVQQFVSEDREFAQENAHAFYGAYLSKIHLTDKEIPFIFPAALFIALMYIIYGDTEKRWKRIQWALAKRTMLEESYRERN